MLIYTVDGYYTVAGYATMAELSSCDRAHMATKPKILSAVTARCICGAVPFTEQVADFWSRWFWHVSWGLARPTPHLIENYCHGSFTSNNSWHFWCLINDTSMAYILIPQVLQSIACSWYHGVHSPEQGRSQENTWLHLNFKKVNRINQMINILEMEWGQGIGSEAL